MTAISDIFYYADMRYLTILFILAMAPGALYAGTSYAERANNCKQMAEFSLNSPQNFSNARMKQVTDDETRCYKKIVTDIIHDKYAANAITMQEQFDAFCTAAQQLAYASQYPDSCSPHCGTIAELSAAATYRQMIQNYAQELISAIGQ